MEITASSITGIDYLKNSLNSVIVRFSDDKYISKSTTDSLQPLKYTDSSFLDQTTTKLGYFSDHIELIGNQEIQMVLSDFSVDGSPNYGTGITLMLWYSGFYQTADNAASGLITHCTHGLMVSHGELLDNGNTTIGNTYFENYATNTTGFPNTAVRLASIGASTDRDVTLTLQSYNYGSTPATSITKYSFCGHLFFYA